MSKIVTKDMIDTAIIIGRNQERERIIKLLEEHTGCGYEHRETEKCFCDAIALIKGEQK